MEKEYGLELSGVDDKEFLGIILSKEDDDSIKNKMYRMTYEDLEMNDEYIDTDLIDECIKTVEMIEDVEITSEEKMQMIRENLKQKYKHNNKQKNKRGYFFKVTRGIAISLLLIFTIVGFVADANGYNAFQIVSDWGKETFHLTIRGGDLNKPEDGIDSNEMVNSDIYSSINEAIKDIIPNPRVPSDIPEGFSLEYVERTNLTEKIILALNYINDDMKLNIYLDIHSQNSEDIDYDALIEKDDTPVEVYTKNNIKHYIMKNNSKIQAVWVYNNTLYTTTGDISIEETKRIIDSIYKK